MPRCLFQIVRSDKLKFISGKIVKKEIELSSNHKLLNGELSKYIENYKYYEYGELLKAFFSVRELEEGEHEIIIISYIFFANNFSFTTIIDDHKPRSFMEHNFPEILQNMTGTVGFVKRCNCKYAIFSKDEAITILNLIKNSKFRIKGKIIDDVVKQIKSC